MYIFDELFGDLFDFNGDGITSLDEEIARIATLADFFNDEDDTPYSLD